MRLYCPTCRTMYDETSERYDATGGEIPCRVCRTTLALEAPPSGFDVDVETEHLAMSQVFTVGDDGKTTMLSPPDEDVYGKTTMIDPTKISAAADLPTTLSPPGNTYGNSPSNYAPTVMTSSSTGPVPALANGPTYEPTVITPAGESFPASQSPASPSPTPQGNFHNDPTFLLSLDQPPGPSAVASAPPPQAPPPQSVSASTQPHAALPRDGEGKQFRRKVVVGGAAVSDGDQKTQAFDLSAFRDIHRGGEAAQEGEPGPNGMVSLTPSPQAMVPVSPAVAPAAPAAPAGALVQPGMASVNPAAVSSAQQPVSRGGSKVPLVIVIVLFLLTACFFLMALEVLPRPGFVPSLVSEEKERPTRPRGPEPEAPIEGETIDRLLVGMRDFVEPPIVSSGEEPSGHAVALGVMSSPTTESAYFWLGTWDSSSLTEISTDYISAIPERADRVFVLFDRTTDTGTMVDVLDALRDNEFSPVLAGGSHLGADSHFAYPAYAPEEAEVLVRFGSRSVSIFKTGWPGPQVYCYRSSVPAERVSAAIDDAFLDTNPPFDVHVELAPNLEIQSAYNLAQALYRPGLLLYISQAESVELPPECQ